MCEYGFVLEIEAYFSSDIVDIGNITEVWQAKERKTCPRCKNRDITKDSI